ncbi:MAG: T9SS type A sorting domain-containing protein, partial [Bacteroidota bacterium]
EKHHGTTGDNKTSGVNRETAEACSPATGSTDLNINNVRARINTGGDMWWDLIGTAKYEIPKGSGKTSLFAGALWIGGVDVNGQLKVAALRFRQVGNDYWPGPLTNDGTASVDASTCELYDKHFVMTRQEVDDFIAWWNDKDAYPEYEIPRSILDWPAHPEGQNWASQSYYLAPFFDRDGGGNYDPTNDGDYPYYDINNDLCPSDPKNMGNPAATTAEGNGILVDQVLKGDQTLWWVFNDKGNIHTESLGAPIGFEIRAQAFAFATNDEINNMSFYSYEIINRSTYRLTETYFSQWIDADLGYHLDDYVGCDVKRGLGYCYNGDDFDGSGKPQEYGTQPPAIGVDFFQGPYMDPDGIDNPKYDSDGEQICDVSINGVNFGDSIIDNERFGMRRFVYHNNNATVTGDPEIAIDYYNYLRGIWKDGTKMQWGGNAHAPGPGVVGPECDFMFPGDSDPCHWGTAGQTPSVYPDDWTEVTAGNQPDDRRFMHSAGPFTLEPGAVNYITVGIPWARASSGGAWASVELLRVTDDKCQRLFDNCFDVVDGPDAPDLTIQELDKEIIIYLENSNTSNNKLESYSEWDPSIVSPDTLPQPGFPRYDSLYRFQGYQIFQLKDATVSVSEIHDPDRARLVAQCDIKDTNKFGTPVAQLVNYYYNEAISGNTPVEEVNGENKGIVHSFRVVTDMFASGDNRLVNHKQYYYLALAYGYNEYLKYSQDPNVLNGLAGQKKPYLAGRKNIVVYTGIPHNPSPEAGGTVMNSVYGTGPKITRIEGQGNGGNILDLTQASFDQILTNNFMLTPEYENSKGPVNVKVVDPLNVKSGNYTLKFIADTVSTVDSASWQLLYNNNLDTVFSEKTIRVANEQLLLDLGLSITIEQVYKPGNIAAATKNGFLEATISYADSSKRWLTGVPDIDGGGYWNWIRSGTNKDDIPANSDIEENNWIDPDENYEKMIPGIFGLGGTWAPYRLCSRKSDDGSGVLGYGLAYSTYHSLCKMEYLASVDIVFTPDQSKWSRCVVLETCDDPVLAEGNAKKFNKRKAQSVGKNGLPDGTGTGMGWFPGYVINVETGERLNIMFGENSWLIGENGRDMIFNPTSNYFTDLGNILWGGQHYVYIVGHNDPIPDPGNPMEFTPPEYDECAWIDSTLSLLSSNQGKVYVNVIYAGIPMAVENESWLSNDVKIRIRVAKPYKINYSTYGATTNIQNNNFPMYTFSTDDIMTKTGNIDAATSALDLINVVPNPYYGYCAYEENQLDNRIKITNLPEECTVSIYTVNGVLVRQYTKDEIRTSIDWDLKNYAGIPISGGVYIIHVKAEGIGEKVIKWFGTLRPIDLNSY